MALGLRAAVEPERQYSDGQFLGDVIEDGTAVIGGRS